MERGLRGRVDQSGYESRWSGGCAVCTRASLIFLLPLARQDLLCPGLKGVRLFGVCSDAGSRCAADSGVPEPPSGLLSSPRDPLPTPKAMDPTGEAGLLLV